MVEMRLSWAATVCYSSLPTSLWASALKPCQHSGLSDPFKHEVLSCHSLFIFSQNESQGPHQGMQGLLLNSFILPLACSLPSTYASSSLFHYLLSRVSFWGREVVPLNLSLCEDVSLLDLSVRSLTSFGVLLK